MNSKFPSESFHPMQLLSHFYNDKIILFLSDVASSYYYFSIHSVCDGARARAVYKTFRIHNNSYVIVSCHYYFSCPCRLLNKLILPTLTSRVATLNCVCVYIVNCRPSFSFVSRMMSRCYKCCPQNRRYSSVRVSSLRRIYFIIVVNTDSATACRR